MIQNLLRTVRMPILALALGALAMPGISYAQAASAPAPDQPRSQARALNRAQNRQQGQRPQRIQQFLDQLDLSADQKQKIEPILEDSRKQIREIVQNTTDPQQRREQMRTATADLRKKINDVLTPEQQAKLQQLMREQRAAAATQPAARGGAGGGMIGRLEQIALSLNLTPEQQAQVKDLSKEYNDEVASILKGNAGAGGQGAGAGRAGRAGGAGQQLRTAVQEYRSRLTQLLTPEQTDQFNKKVGELQMRPSNSDAAGGRGLRKQGLQGGRGQRNAHKL